MMTLATARRHIGHPVTYQSPYVDGVPDEQGVITSVTDMWVFVRYGDESRSKATSPDRLTVTT